MGVKMIMTLNEFIEYLTNLQNEGYGNYEVTIGYRDGGGYYTGSDDVKECNIMIYKSDKVIEL